MPTSNLAGMKVPEAGTERYRRVVYTLMQWNEAHRPLEQWSITTLSIQKLVGGRKDAINAYLDAHRDEIEEHHVARCRTGEHPRGHETREMPIS